MKTFIRMAALLDCATKFNSLVYNGFDIKAVKVVPLSIPEFSAHICPVCQHSVVDVKDHMVSFAKSIGELSPAP